MQNIADALTKANHKIAADGGTHDTTLLPMTTYQQVRVTTQDGKVISGILKNEDSFTLQVLGRTDLNLYRFKRNDVKVFYDPQSLSRTMGKRLRPQVPNLMHSYAFCTFRHTALRGGAVRRWVEGGENPSHGGTVSVDSRRRRARENTRTERQEDQNPKPLVFPFLRSRALAARRPTTSARPQSPLSQSAEKYLFVPCTSVSPWLRGETTLIS